VAQQAWRAGSLAGRVGGRDLPSLPAATSCPPCRAKASKGSSCSCSCSCSGGSTHQEVQGDALAGGAARVAAPQLPIQLLQACKQGTVPGARDARGDATRTTRQAGRLAAQGSHGRHRTPSLLATRPCCRGSPCFCCCVSWTPSRLLPPLLPAHMAPVPGVLPPLATKAEASTSRSATAACTAKTRRGRRHALVSAVRSGASGQVCRAARPLSSLTPPWRQCAVPLWGGWEGRGGEGGGSKLTCSPL
jgi:hypothetical protein